MLKVFKSLWDCVITTLHNFSERTAPLIRLTRKGVPFRSCEGAQAAFEDLREALCGSKVLPYLRYDSKYILNTDASDIE